MYCNVVPVMSRTKDTGVYSPPPTPAPGLLAPCPGESGSCSAHLSKGDWCHCGAPMSSVGQTVWSMLVFSAAGHLLAVVFSAAGTA